MKKKLKLSQSPVAHGIFLVMSVIAVILFNCCNIWWVFINNNVGLTHFCEGLLIFMICNALAMTVMTFMRTYNKGKPNKALSGILFGLTFVFFAFTVGYSIGLLIDENQGVFTLQLQDTLTKALPVIAVSGLALFLPALNKKAKVAISAAVLIVASLWVINDFYPLTAYKITSEPTVIDTSEDYSVVFSTNDYGTGYVEYTFEGEDYKVYDHTAGRLNSDSKIHSINIPYEHLRNNSYRVGSVRVIDEFSYGSRLGKEVVSDEYTLTYTEAENQTYLVISDWHTMLKEAHSAIDYLGDYDSVIFLGDSAPNVDYEEDVAKNTVMFMGQVTGGEKPAIYVRGNHETRGDYANELPTALGLDELYYTLDIGPYSFIVLDSGEDKEDSHSEYGGLTAYGDYRKSMIEWLKTADVKNDKVIALSHAWQISQVEEEFALIGWNEIDRMGARLMISGHTHRCGFVDKEQEGLNTEIFTAHPHIDAYMDGGKSEKDYVASMLTLTPDGLNIKAVNQKGESIFAEEMTW